MLGECGCRTLHLSCWPILPCFCVSSQTYACVRVLWGRDPPFFFFWHSIWHSRVWIHKQLLYASIRHFWHEHYLRTNQTSKTTCCSYIRLLCTGNSILWDLIMGQGFMLWRCGRGNDLGNCHALHLTPPTHLVLSVQLFLRPMLRTRIRNWSGFMKKKKAKEWNCIFTAGPLSKVSDSATKGVHCSKWMGTSSSTGLTVGASMAA